MQITEKPVTAERLQYVFDHLWERGKTELEWLGLGNNEAIARFADYAANGYKSVVLEADETPIVVVGMAGDESGNFTWFQATDAFDFYASAITRYIKREAKQFGKPLSIYSVCVHKDTARWFHALGFNKSDWSSTLPSGHILYRFDRR